MILVVKNKVALTHKCIEDYRLTDKSVLDLIHLKEVRRGGNSGGDVRGTRQRGRTGGRLS